MNYQQLLSSCIASICLLAVGCGAPAQRDATVTGTVLIDGQLAENGTVTFHPVAGGPSASGGIRDDGSYSIRTGQGDLSTGDSGSLNSGEYKVTIVVRAPSSETNNNGAPPPAGPPLTASKYASQATTDLKRTVKPGENLFVFELDGVDTQQASEDEADDAQPVEDADAESDAADDSTAEPTPPAEPAAASEAPTSESATQEDES